MKKLFFAAAALLLCFMISCKDDSKTTTSTTSTTAEKNREHMASVYRGIESGDVSKMDEFVADDVVDHYGMPAEIKGRDSVKKMLADMHNHFSNLQMDIIAEATSANDEYHFTLVRMTGTTTDDKMGMPANTAVDQVSVDVVKIKDGKVTDHWGFEDPKMMMKMMGGMPPMDKPMDKMSDKKDSKMDDKMKDKKAY